MQKNSEKEGTRPTSKKEAKIMISPWQGAGTSHLGDSRTPASVRGYALGLGEVGLLSGAWRHGESVVVSAKGTGKIDGGEVSGARAQKAKRFLGPFCPLIYRIELVLLPRLPRNH